MSRRVRVASLVGSPVEDARGNRLGHVIDLELGTGHEVLALLVGPGTWLRRWNVSRLVKKGRGAEPDRVPWSRVASFESLRIKLKD